MFGIVRGSITGVLALDCEMVGVGPQGERSALARCSIVNIRGEIVYDKYIKPLEKVTGLLNQADFVFTNVVNLPDSRHL
jgi:RNA exonuclease 4